MKRLTMAAFAAIFLPAAGADADLVGTYESGGGRDKHTMTIYYRDDQNLRIEMQEGAYMLVTGPNVYMVQNRGGRTSATDMDQMGAMMQKSGIGGAQAAPADHGDVTFNKTGRTETVAGYKGEVFEVISNGEKIEYVGSNDKDIVALNRAFLVMGKRMSRSFGRDTAGMDAAVRAAEAEGMGGMLRAGDDMRLTSVTKKDVDAGFYKLPPNTVIEAVPDMGDIMRQAEEARRASEKQMQQQQAQGSRAGAGPPATPPATAVRSTSASSSVKARSSTLREKPWALSSMLTVPTRAKLGPRRTAAASCAAARSVGSSSGGLA